MSKVTFEEDELAVVALFQENTRKDTIDILKDTYEALEETKEDHWKTICWKRLHLQSVSYR